MTLARVAATVGLDQAHRLPAFTGPLLTGQTTIAQAVQALGTATSAKADAASLAPVATGGSYNDLTDKPAVSGTNTGDETSATIKTKLGITTLTGSNTGDQTTITGNAGTATALQTARTINGASFDGTANIAVAPNWSMNQFDANQLTMTINLGGTTGNTSVIPLATPSLAGALSGADKAKLNALSGTNTGDQTTITGNAGTATVLQTARTINGVSFDGSANVTINAVDSTARVASALLGVANGVATLDSAGLVPAVQLPSYVDDVLEYANLAALPATGVTGKIYVTLDTNKTYRWSGTVYVYITSGAVDSVAGKTGVVSLVKADVGLGNVDNTSDANKPVSTAQAAADTAVQLAAQAASTPIAHVGTGGTAHANVVASGSAGFMTGADKTKLDGVSGSNTGDETLASIKGKLGITTLSGSNTGDQTTVTGNAGTATVLQTARTIAGVSFDGSAAIAIPYANLTGLPTLGTAAAKNVPATGNASATEVVYGTDTRLTDSRVANGGNAATVTTNANLTGVVTSTGNATSIAAGAITNAMLSNSAVANLSGTNTGDNAVNTNYSSDYRAANFVVRTNYAEPTTALATGLLKNTTGTGAHSIAVQADITALLGAGSITNTMLANSAVANLSGTNTGDQVLPVAASTTPAALGTAAVGVGTTWARADHVHQSPTTVTGNAGTATVLQTARTINGVAFDGSANITINAVDSTARVASSLVGAVSGIAQLDSGGKVPASQLPAYVDDVLEYANLAALPATGTAGLIYVALDTNKCYRWSGTAYVYITSGAVDSVAGKTGVVSLVKADVGLGSVDNTADSAKPVSTAQATANTAVQTAAASDATTKANAAQAAAIAASAPLSHVGTGGTAHANVVAAGAAGFMTGADKTKLDGIATGATANTGTVTQVTGSGAISVINTSTTPAISIAAASTGAPGTMSAVDKTKLDAITGTNTGDETAGGIRTKLGITTLSGSNTGDQTIAGLAGSPTAAQLATALSGQTMNVAGSATTITGTYAGAITSGQVTTGLGFTPYNSTNPSGYITSAGVCSGLNSTGLGVANIWTANQNIKNVGVGINVNVGWNTGYSVVDFAGGAGIGTFGNASIYMLSNSYHDGTNYRAKATAIGSSFGVNANGSFYWASMASVTAGAIQTPVTELLLDATGNLTATANVTAYSDERLKSNWELLSTNFVDQLAQVKNGTYDRIDTGQRQVGVSAQSLQTVLPDAVLTSETGMLSVAYGNAALAACVELAKEVVALRARLAVLEAK